MIRILFIIEHLGTGGAEKSLVNLLNSLDYNKYEVDLLLLQDVGDYLPDIPQRVKVHLYSNKESFGPFFSTIKKCIKSHDFFAVWFRMIYIVASRFGWKYLKLSRGLYKDIKGHYDYVVAYRHSICAEMAAYVFAGRHRVVWWHHGEIDVSGNRLRTLNDTFGIIDNIVAVSNSSKALVENAFENAKGKTLVIPNLISIEDISNKANERVFINSKGKILISVGRLEIEKNMMLIPSIADILSKMYSFTWFIIGDGTEYNNIRQQIVDMGLEESVILLGSQSNPYPFIKSADVFVHTSLVESQGIAILESMALRVPTICVKSDGPKEFIKNGINGFLSEADAYAIADRIDYCFQNPELCRVITDNGFQTAKEFSKEKIDEKIQYLFKKEE